MTLRLENGLGLRKNMAQSTEMIFTTPRIESERSRIQIQYLLANQHSVASFSLIKKMVKRLVNLSQL